MATINYNEDAAMDQQHLSVIRSSAIDGRAHNSFFRRTQLKRLHEALVNHAGTIQSSMREDGALTDADVEIEFCLALQCVVESHDAIDPAKEMEEEYSIARGADQPNSRRPVGVVIIEPSLYAFVHSLIAALAPALAAGNCVVIQVSPTSPKSNL